VKVCDWVRQRLADAGVTEAVTQVLLTVTLAPPVPLPHPVAVTAQDTVWLPVAPNEVA
jgi:hypothetical protein